MKEAQLAIWKHPLVLGAIAITAVIAIGSVIYYVVATALPSTTLASPTMSSIEEVVTGTGTVEPAQNPDLAFVSGGRVTRVNVAVGQTVSAGQLLASLDTSTLAAQRANAAANLASQQAKLSEMQAGPRDVDRQAKQTAVSQANQTVSNAYANVAANITDAYDKALSNVGSNTDTLFNQANTPSPTLVFNTTNSQAASDAANGRAQANNTLATWNTALQSISSASSPQQLDAALTSAIANLQTLRDFSSKVLVALSGAVSSSNFTQAQITAAQTSIGAMRDTINGQILALQGIQQQLANDKLAVQSAQDALNQILAGSTPQDIAGQQAQVDAASANVALYNAQINNSIVVAPFSGTVSSVRIKSGDIVAANTPAISLNPEGALQISVYVSEVDAAKISVGQKAAVTLDAYGSAEPFDAVVASIDRSPTMQNGIPGYKATLQFASTDTHITSGATANVSIITGQKDNALVIPKNALLQSNGQNFVLIQIGGNLVQHPITVGIEGTSTVEVTSGLSTSDKFLINNK